MRGAGTPALRHYNPLGTVHGGYAATLLDSCMGCAVHTTLPKGTGYTTLEFKVSLVRSITADTGPVRAEGKLVSGGRRVATAEGRLTDGSGRLLAHATIAAGGFTVSCLAYSPDGRTLAAGTTDERGPNLFLIDVRGGKLISSRRLAQSVSSVAYSSDGKLLVTGHNLGMVRVWDATAGGD